jgi:hypothetical protein
VHEFIRLELDFEISISRLKRVFNCSRAAVRRSLKNALEPPKPCGRQTALADDAEADILDRIYPEAEKSQPSMSKDILDSRPNKFGKSITRGWVDLFPIRQDCDSGKTVSNLQENRHSEIA